MRKDGTEIVTEPNDHTKFTQFEKNGYGCGAFALLIGLILLGAAIWQMQEADAFIGRAVSAQGEVVRMDSEEPRDDERSTTTYYIEQGKRRRNDSSDPTLYTAIIGYTDKTGVQHEVREQISKSSPTRTVGDKVSILYDPNDPAQARVDDFIGRSGRYTALGGLGLFFAGGATLYLILVMLGRKARLRTEEKNIAVAQMHQAKMKERQ